MLTEKINELCRLQADYMVTVRRHLHANPGVGFDNMPTMDFVKNQLSEAGISARFLGKCGVVGEIGKGEPCFMLRADSDGLSIKEESDLPFASKNGCMHGCGHDMHTAMLLGAARVLKCIESDICGSVRLMLQSAEESLEGASDMINCGVLENPEPIGAMMLHVMTATEVKTGTVIVPFEGVSAPCADFFEIEIRGVGCHGSSPSEGVDSVYAGATLVTALSEITSREISMRDSVILTIGSFNAGDGANVIPEIAVLKGTLRCSADTIREYVKARICEISKGICQALRAECTVKFTSGCPALINDKRLCDTAGESLGKALGADFVLSASDFQKSSKTSGSEDFAYISRRVPSIMLALAAGNIRDGYSYPLHHPRVKFDENAMVNGCIALCTVALEMINKSKSERKNENV